MSPLPASHLISPVHYLHARHSDIPPHPPRLTLTFTLRISHFAFCVLRTRLRASRFSCLLVLPPAPLLPTSPHVPTDVSAAPHSPHFALCVPAFCAFLIFRSPHPQHPGFRAARVPASRPALVLLLTSLTLTLSLRPRLILIRLVLSAFHVRVRVFPTHTREWR
ncbi:hypothetical protein B0H11DRAFT_2294611 [Mycena galericulata]|nr:hypothetical protein B0H11DRAFT_2294611 [Mycena galericulata]